MHGRKSSEQITFANEFVEFTKPIVKVAYSPGGDLLIACCVDGSVSFHNANRDHLLIKRIYLTFPPQNLHVAFSPITRSKKVKVIKDGLNYQQSFPDGLPADENIDASNCIELQHSIEDEFESLFGLMGEHGNNVMIYDTESFVLRNQIQAGHFVKIFQFTSSTEIIIATMDQKIKFYSLKEFGGVFQREISTVHRGSITTTSISENKQYLLTGGEDNLLKIWDY